MKKSVFPSRCGGTIGLYQFKMKDEHNSEAESLAVKEFNPNFSAQLHIHLVLSRSKSKEPMMLLQLRRA
jgi:hypothetical protein